MTQPTPSDDLIVLLRVVRNAIDDYLEARGVSDASEARPRAEASTAAPSAAPAAAAPAPPTTPAPSANGDATERARTALLGAIVEQTGYPEELIEDDLDLEGDLGIDTVKQVAILAGVRESFGLTVDEDFRLRDHNTLSKLAGYVGGRLQAEGR